MNTLSFKVELLFFDPIKKDKEIMEVANNIVKAIQNQAKEAIAPEGGDNYLVEVKVSSSNFIIQVPI